MATPTSRSRSTRAFRALLRLLPFDFRLEHGREMEQVFQAQQQEAHHEGTVRAVARLWLEAVNDLLTTAPRQHVAMLRQDVGYAMRTLRRTPGFAAAAILTLAIGISASAIIFTIINAFLFRPRTTSPNGPMRSASGWRSAHSALTSFARSCGGAHGSPYPVRWSVSPSGRWSLICCARCSLA